MKIENSEPQQYTITLSADSNWLNSPDRAYPVIIDPTVTHNADSNFTGQMNRIADADSTSSTQLEASYPEATKDPYAVLLLHFNEASGSTNIKDYASTTRVITANGNASTTNATTRLGMGNSAAFDGTTDYFSVPDSGDWNFGGGDFTIETMVRFTSVSASQMILDQDGTGNARMYIYFSTSSGLNFRFANSASTVDTNQGNTSGWLTGVWYHLAVIRSGSSINVYRDGISIASNTISIAGDDMAATLEIGRNSAGAGEELNGYLDSFRIIKGRALTPEEIKAAASRRPYAVYTSPVLDATVSTSWNTVNWTEGGVRTGNGEQPYNTNSLVAQWDFNDTSGTTLTASSSGSCTTACNGTLTNFAYIASQDQATTTTGWTANNKKWGAGALMFDGVNDYVSVADSDNWNFGSGDFSIEFWMRFNVVSNYQIFFGQQTDANNRVHFRYTDDSSTPRLQFQHMTGGLVDIMHETNWTPSAAVWYHIALVKSSNTYTTYVNGASIGSTADSSSNADFTGNFYIGSHEIAFNQLFNGILDSLRIYKGRALSTAEILSNYQAGNIEIQTRSGATSDPNDGTWEAWKPTTGETQLLSLDSDAVNWRSDIMASTTIATSTDTVLKMEGTGSLKIEMGKASSTVNTGVVALWHFEETGTSTGTYLYDETANNNDATTTGTTVTDGIFGKGRKFNGTSDYVSAAALTGGTAVQSIDFWVYPQTTTEYFVDLNGSAYVWANAGTVTATGFTSPTIYVNGLVSSAIVAGQWQYVAVTTGTGINASLPRVGKTPTNNYLEGNIDEIKILNRALSADEIAGTYRMGANHHLTRQISATDLSGANKLAFNVAADRTGTFLEAMIGESDHSNYELASSTLALSTNTVLYIKGDEIASSTSIKDSSFSGKAITANGDAKIVGAGKIGNALYFDGTGDYFSVADSDDFTFGSGEFTIDLWIKRNTTGTETFFGQSNWGANYTPAAGNFNISNKVFIFFYEGTTQYFITSTRTITDTAWHHIATGRSGNTGVLYIDGVPEGTVSLSGITLNNSTTVFSIGQTTDGSTLLNGYIDEFRIVKGTALTPDQIRQTYEYGLRSHQITIDFGATLQPSDLISNSTDYNFSLTATTSGLSATTSGLYLGDKIIVKENLGGTEYAAQGTVNAINTTTGAITVPSWDTGSTFPSGNGYSPNATVFKWQREYFDITGAATTTRDAITNLTIRPTNGAGGRTVWLDDFRYNTNYLTASSSSAITSGNNRYLQYRTILTSTDSFVSPFLSAFSTLYTALANSFPPIIGTSGGGFMAF